jgi:hypothetical protein
MKMETKYHRNVTKAVIEFAREENRFRDVENGNRTPLRIPHPYQKRSSIFYRPDVYFHTKNNRIYIFEILDSELKQLNLIIADAIQSFLTPYASKVFFILPTKDKEIIDNVFDSVAVIWNTLDYLIDKKYKLPDEVFFYTVTRKDAITIKKIKKKLRFFCKKHRW